MAIQNNVLKTILVSIPVALIVVNSSYGLWLLAGFPVGYIPQIFELPPPILTASQCLLTLNYIQYLFYGGLLGVLVARDKSPQTRSQLLVGSSIVGSITGLVTRIAVFLPQIIGDTFPKDFIRVSASVAALLFTVVLGIVLTSVGALTIHALLKRRRGK